MVRKIVDVIPDVQLQKDLNKYQQRAIELGATDARIISSDMVIIDERVRAKCIYPKCGFYGTNAHCPPHTLELEQVRKIVGKFQYAIFTMLRTTQEELQCLNTDGKKSSPYSQVKNNEIVSKIESEAFYDGYHLAIAFGAGPCKLAFCPDNECAVLISGQSCRHPLRGRTSMEGAGMDAFLMAAQAGWDIYPIGTNSPPSEDPLGARLGLVLIY